MSTRDDGGPAFPTPPAEFTHLGEAVNANNGMSLRAYFAAHAPPMPPAMHEMAKRAEKADGKDCSDYGAYAEWQAKWRKCYADAQIKELGL